MVSMDGVRGVRSQAAATLVWMKQRAKSDMVSRVLLSTSRAGPTRMRKNTFCAMGMSPSPCACSNVKSADAGDAAPRGAARLPSPASLRSLARAAWARRWWSVLSTAVQQAIGQTANTSSAQAFARSGAGPGRRHCARAGRLRQTRPAALTLLVGPNTGLQT